MIEVGGKQITTIPEAEGFTPNELQKSIFDKMLKSSSTYKYGDARELTAELKIRNSIVNAARELNKSGFRFKVFRESTVNPDFWRRTNEGGFQLKSGVLPSDAINDIYRNGSMYGTECATAMLIVLYKAMLDVMPVDQFNKLYSDIYLMDWKSIDRDLALVSQHNIADELPGDARYFMNPDVDPLRPEWQGENVYYLGGGRYYGHGLGINDADSIIRSLNSARKHGATRSAYLMDPAKRQDYRYLSKYIK